MKSNISISTSTPVVSDSVISNTNTAIKYENMKRNNLYTPTKIEYHRIMFVVIKEV